MCLAVRLEQISATADVEQDLPSVRENSLTSAGKIVSDFKRNDNSGSSEIASGGLSQVVSEIVSDHRFRCPAGLVFGSTW